jgi:hypothetical protein
MKTTKFDATELGLVAKYDLEVANDSLAYKEVGDTYFLITKVNSTLMQLRREQGNSVKINYYTTLREALKAL